MYDLSEHDRPLREGYRFHDVRYGHITILAVTDKQVWYQREVCDRAVYRTSLREAMNRLEYGPEWADRPRWFQA